MNSTSSARRNSFRPELSGTALALASLLSVPAGAADLSELALEDLLRVDVVSASRFAQSTEDAPATVSVIGEEELRSHGYRNLAEALVTLPGVYSSYDRGYTLLGVRGFNRPGDYGSRLLLLTDGARRNDPLYDQALFGNEAPIEIDWVKRLEFVTGPASAVYGSNALFGTVNTVMLSGADVDGYRVTVDAGSDDSKHVGLVAGKTLEGDREWFVGFSAYKSDGADLDFPAFNGADNGQANGLDGEEYQKLYAKYRWGNWRLTANWSSRDKDIPTGWYDTTFGNSGTTAKDESRLIELRYDGDVRNGWKPSFRIFNGSYRFDGDYNYDPDSNTKDHAHAEWTGTELQMAYTGIAAHKLVVGVDAQWNTRVEQEYYEADTGNMILDTDDTSRTFGLYAQDEWRFHPQWLLNVGLRYDKHSDFDAVTSPRAALIWQPTQRLSLKGIVGSSYRTPNAYERFYNDGGDSQNANPDLQPEEVASVELAAGYRFGQNGRVGLSVYRNEITDLIDQVTDSSGVSTFINQDKVKARGVEVDAENRWVGGVRLRGSIAWQKSEKADGTGLVDSPKWLGKAVLCLPVAFGWTANGEIIGVSSRKGDNGRVPGYGIVNLSLLSAPAARFGQFSLSLYNLGDKKYYDPTSHYMAHESIEQDGRQFRLRWTLPL